MKILAVDDDDSMLEQTKLYLEKKGWSVETTHSAEKAMEMVEEGAYDAVISDYQMPEMSGLDFLRIFRMDGHDIPFVIYTGKGPEEIAINALNLGANSYFQKGGDPGTTYDLMAQAIEKEVAHYRARMRVEESERRYRTVFENTGTATIIADREGNITMANRMFLEYAKRENVKNLGDFLDIPVENGTFEGKFLREKDMIVNITGIPETHRYVITLTDITQRKEMENDLKEAKERYEKLANEMNDAVLVYRPDGNVLFANESMEQMFGYGNTVPNMKELNAPEYRDTFDARIDGVLEKGEMSYECVYITRKNRSVPVEVNSVITDHDGELAILSVVRDISVRKQREERVDFLHSLLRHDLRNKAQIIMGYLNLINVSSPVTEEQGRYIDKAIKGVKEQIELVEKVRTLLQVEDIQTVQYDLGVAVSNALEQLSSMLDEKGVEVNFRYRDGIVMGGPLLADAVHNLLRNAIQHSHCTSLNIQFDLEGEHLRMVLEDDGIGISEDIRETLFDPGVKRGENAGTGLGLYLVKSIIDSYGGDISLGENNRGSRFTVTLKRP